MAATNTYVDSQGVRRWRPSAVCPVHGMTCERAFTKRIHGSVVCTDSHYGDDDLIPGRVTCPTFQCEYCGKHVPLAFGCADDMPGACDACWAEVHGDEERRRRQPR